MKTLDYKLLLLALDAVIRGAKLRGGAAQRLHITQSAISQRIKQLEQQLRSRSSSTASRCRPRGSARSCWPTIARCASWSWSWPASSPRRGPGPHPGQHRRQCRQPGHLVPARPGTTAGAIPIELNLLVDDESRTLDRVREGGRSAVRPATPAAGGLHVDELGEMRYLLTASPAFVARHFPERPHGGGPGQGAGGGLRSARRHAHQLHGPSFRPPPVAAPATWCDPPGLRRHGGAGAGLLPHPGIADPPATGRGRLLDLSPDHHLVPEQLYWHRWVLEQGCTSRYPSA